MSFFTNEKTLVNKYKKMYQNSELVDFEITVKETVFKLHRFVLAVQNSFFYNLILNDPLLKTFETDVDPKAFEIFIKYVYTGQVETSKVNSELLQIANQFSAEKLKQFCDRTLSLKINESNAVHNLVLAVECNCREMKERACEVIAENYKELKESPEFEDVLKNHEATLGILNEQDKMKEKLNKQPKEPTTIELEDFEKSLESIDSTKMKIKIKNDVMISLHKIIPENQEEAKVSEEDFSNTIDLPDDVEKFQLLQEYLSKKNVAKADICNLFLVVADKCCGSALGDFCESQLRKTVNKENYIDLVEVALKNNYDLLLARCAKFFVDNYYKEIDGEKTVEIIKREFRFTEAVLWEFQQVIEEKINDLDKMKSFQGNFFMRLPKTGCSFSKPFFVGYMPWRIKVFIIDNCICLEPEVECSNRAVFISSNIFISLVPYKEINLLFYKKINLECKKGFYILQWTEFDRLESVYIEDGQIKVEIKMNIQNVSIKSE